MPQKSYAYAAGRAQVLGKNLLNAGALERLVAAPGIDETARVLTDYGWGDVRTKKDLEDMAARHVVQACALVRDITPEPEATDGLLMGYDILNLKMLFKARTLKKPLATLSLSPCGLIDPDQLARCVDEAQYADLPPELKAAASDIEKQLSVAPDPLLVDTVLDSAWFSFVAARIPKIRSEALVAYYRARADLANLMIALRAHAMGRGAAFARTLFVQGGALSPDVWAKITDDPERAPLLLQGAPYARALKAALSGEGPAAVEKAADDYLLSLIYPKRYDTTSVLPLVYYLLVRLREAGAVRLIATAKAANLPEEQLTSRLRALY